MISPCYNVRAARHNQEHDETHKSRTCFAHVDVHKDRGHDRAQNARHTALRTAVEVSRKDTSTAMRPVAMSIPLRRRRAVLLQPPLRPPAVSRRHARPPRRHPSSSRLCKRSLHRVRPRRGLLSIVACALAMSPPTSAVAAAAAASFFLLLPRPRAYFANWASLCFSNISRRFACRSILLALQISVSYTHLTLPTILLV